MNAVVDTAMFIRPIILIVSGQFPISAKMYVALRCVHHASTCVSCPWRMHVGIGLKDEFGLNLDQAV